MPDRSTLYQDFFKSENFREGPKTFTIIKETAQEIGQDKDVKSVLYFEEDPRGFVLNKTNYGVLTEAFGSADTDKWIGGKITLSFDPDVKFGGRKVGGIAVERAG